MEFIRRVSVYLFRYKGLFYLTIALAVGSMFCSLLVPRVMQWVFDEIIETRRINYLGGGVAFIALCFLGRELLNCFRIRVNNALEQKVLLDLREQLHAKLLLLPVSFYDRNKSGEVASRVTEDVQTLEGALLDGTEQGTVALLSLIGISGMLFWMEYRLALLVLIPLPILSVMAYRHFLITRKNWRSVREAAGEMNSLLVEDIQANRIIHSFGLMDREHDRFMDAASTLKERTLRAMFRWSWYNPTTSFISSMGTVAVVGMGGYFLMADGAIAGVDFSFGEYIAFIYYCTMLYEPLWKLNALNHMFSQARASGERVFEILDYEEEIKDGEHPVAFPDGPLTVKYENVKFAYADRDTVIDGLNLELDRRKVTALVGHTGAGKSTIANLLMRYYDVSLGAVSINGEDVRNIALAELRSNIGFVPQDPFLFNGTVRDNLLLAKGDATEGEVIEALKGARAWEFVSVLPQGLDTIIGERGILLSMGEKQRITIARVLLRNPSIIVLDEATSSVDSITEAKIQEAFDLLVRDRTVLVIAHRLSTIRRADKIVVLEKGRILEMGNHETLIRQQGHYAKLWETQNNFLPETI